MWLIPHKGKMLVTVSFRLCYYYVSDRRQPDVNEILFLILAQAKRTILGSA